MIARRRLLGSTGALAGLASLGGLAGLGDASASDYRALVVLMLEGGYDGHHTLVPTDGAFNDYVRARANLAALCQSHLKGRCEVEIVDVFKEPQRALAEGIFMTPTLIQRAPAPVRRIVGTLGDADTLLQTLAIEDVPA